jgi:hypothetical protein
LLDQQFRGIETSETLNFVQHLIYNLNHNRGGKRNGKRNRNH